ncbi:hypothetical protein CsSME_00002350 [Camellia sinensis var. sinensis]
MCGIDNAVGGWTLEVSLSIPSCNAFFSCSMGGPSYCCCLSLSFDGQKLKDFRNSFLLHKEMKNVYHMMCEPNLKMAKVVSDLQRQFLSA